MLVRLSIRDVVLIDKLDVEFHTGLCVLTGETGAGKSILLDALGLALGRRADSGLVRRGAERAVVSAAFEIDPDHPVAASLRDQGLDAGRGLVLRRVLRPDGRSRAFVNDQPVTVGLLADLGGRLVEVYGQNDRMGLLDTATHRVALDHFGGLLPAAETLAAAFDDWRAAQEDHDDAMRAMSEAQADREDLRYALDELEALDPRGGEEKELADGRAMLRAAEKITEALNVARRELTSGRSAEDAINLARRLVSDVAPAAGGRLDELAASLDRAAFELAEALTQIEAVERDVDGAPGRLEQVEERLFALRAVARKHRVSVDGLPALRDSISARIAALEAGDSTVAEKRAAVHAARAAYVEHATALGQARRDAAARLDKLVSAELDGLRMPRARFQTRCVALSEDAWTRAGAERVAFEVATIPEAEPGPIRQIASGGELSRFMLALRVVLAGVGGAGTLVFDEIDAGIGGAVADAVGLRLAGLCRGDSGVQVLAVTHQPQVAARADAHYRVVKTINGAGAETTVEALSETERREEVARMLAGAAITDEARAAARSLIAAGETEGAAE